MKVRYAATAAILTLFVIPIAAHAQIGEGAREGAAEGSHAAGPVGGVVGGVLGGAAGAVGGALGVHPHHRHYYVEHRYPYYARYPGCESRTIHREGPAGSKTVTRRQCY